MFFIHIIWCCILLHHVYDHIIIPHTMREDGLTLQLFTITINLPSSSSHDKVLDDPIIITSFSLFLFIHRVHLTQDTFRISFLSINTYAGCWFTWCIKCSDYYTHIIWLFRPMNHRNLCVISQNPISVLKCIEGTISCT